MQSLQCSLLNMAYVSPFHWPFRVVSHYPVQASLCKFFLYPSDSSFVPPLVYAFMGSSRDIAIGPVAVVSLLLGSLLQQEIDPTENPTEYLHLAFTATFFAGITQATLGFLRFFAFHQCTLKIPFGYFLYSTNHWSLYISFCLWPVEGCRFRPYELANSPRSLHLSISGHA